MDIVQVITDKALEQYPRIYCFVDGKFLDIDRRQFAVCVVAVDASGKRIADHVSTNEQWAKYDIGITSARHHNRYFEIFPDGFELEWVDKPLEHPVLSQYLEAKS